MNVSYMCVCAAFVVDSREASDDDIANDKGSSYLLTSLIFYYSFVPRFSVEKL